MKGQLSDYHFAPTAEPGAPPVAIRRFPAQTADEVTHMVRKTLRLETQPASADWRQRLIVLAGNPGSGPVAEMIADATMLQRLQRLHSSWYVRAISCSAKSRYFVPGDKALPAFLHALDQGGLFTAFMGHSSASGMWLTGNHQRLEHLEMWTNAAGRKLSTSASLNSRATAVPAKPAAK